jgi:hypothetical protein
MPPHELEQALTRLHGEAAAVLSGSESERESQDADAETEARFQRGRDVCQEVLGGIGGGGESV